MWSYFTMVPRNSIIMRMCRVLYPRTAREIALTIKNYKPPQGLYLSSRMSSSVDSPPPPGLYIYSFTCPVWVLLLPRTTVGVYAMIWWCFTYG